jgi:hypothetical protein
MANKLKGNVQGFPGELGNINANNLLIQENLSLLQKI